MIGSSVSECGHLAHRTHVRLRSIFFMSECNDLQSWIFMHMFPALFLAVDDGKVYGWGSNSEGQLGLGEEVDTVEQPTLIKLAKKASYIACGYYHSAIITGKQAQK